MRVYDWVMTGALIALVTLGLDGQADAFLLLAFGMVLAAGIHELSELE